MKFNIRIYKIREDLLIAGVPELQGCYVQGEDEFSIRIKMADAIKAYLKSYEQHHEKSPIGKK